MATAASNVYVIQAAFESASSGAESGGVACLFSKSVDRGHTRISSRIQKVEVRRLDNLLLLNDKQELFSGGFGRVHHKRLHLCNDSGFHVVHCMSNGSRKSETAEHGVISEKIIDRPSERIGDGNPGVVSPIEESSAIFRCSAKARPGIAVACKYAYNDAKFVNERARNDIALLSRGIRRLDNRARQDVAVLGMEFLKLDARAREDTEKIDGEFKTNAARLNHLAMILKNTARTKLKKAAEEHWNDGALEADLRRADVIFRRRAMEDAFVALQLVRNIHDTMVSKLLLKEDSSLRVNDVMSYISLERNGVPIDLFPEDISKDRIAALQEVYSTMTSALSEADGIDYNDPEELELLVATLIDLDAMDGKSSALLLAECSSSPDVNTRKALANALAAAPSMWTLGNAGMGALQRLAEDKNPAVAAAASNTIAELKRQWEVQEGDNLTFVMNHPFQIEDSDENSSDVVGP